jgi:uncharacterized protein YecE (DUF72 family)
MRLHAGIGHPAGCYGDRALASRAALIHQLFGARADVFVYFNNDGHACAIDDARRFARAAARIGLRPTRTDVALPRCVA